MADGGLGELKCVHHAWCPTEAPTKLHKDVTMDEGAGSPSPYVLDVKVWGDRLCAGLTDGSVMVYNVEGLRLERELRGHVGSVLSCCWHPSDRNVLLSGGWDGKLVLWDLRMREPGAVAEGPGEESSPRSVALSSEVSAAARGSSVWFGDLRRNLHQVGVFEESHSEPVSDVWFHPTLEMHLVSAGEDHIVNVFDTRVSGEGDALVETLSADGGLAKTGWFGPDGAFLWGITQSEMLTLWSLGRAETITTFPGIRESCAAASIDCTSLIQCWQHPEHPDAPLWLLGSSWESGQGTLFTVTPDDVCPAILLPQHEHKGHNDSIHCAAFLPTPSLDTPTLVTGGEDGRLCLWTAPETPAPESVEPKITSHEARLDRAKARRKHRREKLI